MYGATPFAIAGELTLRFEPHPNVEERPTERWFDSGAPYARIEVTAITWACEVRHAEFWFTCSAKVRSSQVLPSGLRVSEIEVICCVYVPSQLDSPHFSKHFTGPFDWSQADSSLGYPTASVWLSGV